MELAVEKSGCGQGIMKTPTTECTGESILNPVIKSEPTYYNTWEDTYYSNTNQGSSPGTSSWRGRERGYYGGGGRRLSYGSRMQRPWRNNSRGTEGFRRQKNPPGNNGQPSKCFVCGSIYHWKKDCTSS